MLSKNNIFSPFKRHSGLWLVCLLFLLSKQQGAQVNLVVDPSFEVYDTCDANMWLRGSRLWHSLDSNIYYSHAPFICTPIYCNTCSSFLESSLPHNHLYGPGSDSYRYPKSGGGLYLTSGYLSTINSPQDNRCFLRGHLTRKLDSGKLYCGKYYVSLYKQCQYATDRTGAYLDDGSLDVQSPCLPIIVTPQFENPTGNIITDTTIWTRIQGIFTANGTERFITIGNFYSDANSNVLLYNPSAAKNEADFYTDDVSVIAMEIKADGGPDQTLCIGDSITLGRPQEIGLECQWYLPGNPVPFSSNSDFTFKATQTGTYTFVQRMDNCAITFDTVNITVVQDCNPVLVIPNVFSPNEDGINDTWNVDLKGSTNVHYYIYNRWGNLIHQNDLSTQTYVQWDGRTTAGEKCPNGIYYYVIEYADKKGEQQKKNGYVSLFR